MTVEELNVVIRANTIDFQKHINDAEKELVFLTSETRSASSGVTEALKNVTNSSVATAVSMEKSVETVGKKVDFVKKDIVAATDGMSDAFKNTSASAKTSATSVQKSIDGVEKELDSMQNSAINASAGTINAFKAIAASAAVTTVVKLFSTATTAAGELEQNLGGSEAVFKQYAATLQNTAKEAYSSLGLSESAYLATANKMGALFQGSGFTIQQSADMTAQAMQRAADVASIMGVSVDDAMNAVAGAAKGNFTMMDNLGVAINDTTLKIYAQEKGLGELLTTQDKVNAAMQMFMEKSEYAAGNYMKENSTYAGALTTFKAEMQNFAAEAGTAMLPLATAAIPVLTQVLTAAKPILLGLSTSIGELGQVVTTVSEALQNATPQQQAALKLALGMAVAIPAVTTATKLMTGAKMLYNTALTILIPKQLTYATALKATMGWIGLILGALALLGIATNKNSTAVDTGAESLAVEAEEAGKAADNINKAADSTKNLGSEIKRTTAGFDELNRLGSGTTLGSNIIADEDIAAVDEYSEKINELMETDFSISPELDLSSFDSGISLFEDMLDNLGLLFGVSDFSEIWDEFWGDIGLSAEKVLRGFRHDNPKLLRDGLVELNDIISSTKFGEKWSDFWQGVGNALFGFKEKLHNEIIPETESFIDKLNNFILTGKWENTGSYSQKEKVKELSKNAEENKSKMPSSVEEYHTIMALEASSGTAIGDAFERLKIPVGGINENPTFNPYEYYSAINQKKIHGYASGGFPDYGSIFIANEAGPELVGTIGGRTAVANNSQIETAIYNAVRSAISDGSFGGNNQGGDIHVTVELDGDVVGESVVRYNEKRTKRFNGH